jgi:demethylmenaquinone methyltransferase / 2-methoxy-6-polyprenyl-1,4-benzoquinol methylase
MTDQFDSTRPLHKMFTQVPPSYDFLNRLLTFRLDEHWRKQTAKACLANKPKNVLDLCTGTGDLVLRLRKMAPDDLSISALDYSQPMLDEAQKKAKKKKISGIEFIHGDAANMPFSDIFFDSIGIAFAFRNLTFHNPDRDIFLAEILRVLKPGGRFVIIETSQPKNKIIRSLFHFYLRYITVPIGGLFSGHYGAYKYLAHSAKNYHNNQELSEILKQAGFQSVKCHPKMFGISTLYVAEK